MSVMVGTGGKALGVGLLLAAGVGLSVVLTHRHDAAELERLAERSKRLEAELRIATERIAQLERRSCPRCPSSRRVGPEGDTRPGAAARDQPAPSADDPSEDGRSASQAAPPAPDEASPQWDRRWLDAWERDAERYGEAAMEQIEQLYREGGDDFDTVEGREKLASLVEQYPESNRAKCAAMNLGGAYLEEGDLDQAQAWLELVIDAGSGAVFGNGEAVLPKALFNYGLLWREQGDEAKAQAAWQRIADELADATDASGTPYGMLVATLLGEGPP